MANTDKILDGDAKDILRGWPLVTKLWKIPTGTGLWLRAQPVPKTRKGRSPTLAAPGAEFFRSQPDGLWICFSKKHLFCDIVVVEHCGTISNMNDKRSRYMGSSTSLLVACTKDWFEESIVTQGGGSKPRWQVAGVRQPKTAMRYYAVRGLRLLLALPSDDYEKWGSNHLPMAHEFVCKHSSLASYQSRAMQSFLKQMSLDQHFYTKVQ